MVPSVSYNKHSTCWQTTLTLASMSSSSAESTSTSSAASSSMSVSGDLVAAAEPKAAAATSASAIANGTKTNDVNGDTASSSSVSPSTSSSSTSDAASSKKSDTKKKQVKFSEPTSSSSAANTLASLNSASNSGVPNQDALMRMLMGMKDMKLSDVQAAVQAQTGQNSRIPQHKFWSTQPVPQLTGNETDLLNAVTAGDPYKQLPTTKSTSTTAASDSSSNENEPIETKKVSDISTTPYTLPEGFYWVSMKMSSEGDSEEVYQLLHENYVEDDDNMFRFNYSRKFLQWALMPPGYKEEWHIGVRHSKTNKLYAFISGIPASIRVYDKVVDMVEINFLCIYKKLRSKRLAPVLIKEVTRRVNLHNIWQAAYTAGVVLPKPIASNRYYHRSLNPKKLIEIGFSRLPQNMTMARTIKLYRLKDEFKCTGLRPMVTDDIPDACKLLNTYLQKFSLAPSYSEADFAHWFLPRDDVIYTYVRVDDTTGQLTDMTSFYCLPSSVIGHPHHTTLRAAYSFYHVATSCSWEQLMQDSLVAALRNNFDVYNALNVMENQSFFKSLMFGPGDGNLQYYLYNWRCTEMNPNQVGLVLL